MKDNHQDFSTLFEEQKLELLNDKLDTIYTYLQQGDTFMRIPDWVKRLTFSTEQVADAINRSPSYVRLKHREGILKSIKINGNLRFTFKELDRMVKIEHTKRNQPYTHED